jgi:hypothetical protein
MTWAALAASTNAPWMPAQHADEAVVDDDVADRDQERHPVLVEREDADHHEEVEVRLGDAAPQVHEHRGGGDQAERGRRDTQAQVDLLGRGDRGGQRKDRALERHVQNRLAAEQAERREADDVQPEQPDDRMVAAAEDVLGEHLALRQPVPDRLDGATGPGRLGRPALTAQAFEAAGVHVRHTWKIGSSPENLLRQPSTRQASRSAARPEQHEVQPQCGHVAAEAALIQPGSPRAGSQSRSGVPRAQVSNICPHCGHSAVRRSAEAMQGR